MAIEITMPQLSDTMNDGKILAWRKKVGDPIKRGDTLAEVATDKADLEIEAFHEGTLLKINVDVGTTVRVGSVIAVIGDAGEASSASTAAAPQAAPVAPAPVAAAPVQTAPVQAAPTYSAPVQAAPAYNPPPAPVQSHSGANGVADSERVKISPLAKNFAENHGVDYTKLKGSGEGGRIVRRDVEGAIEQSAPASAPVAPVSEVRSVPSAPSFVPPVPAAPTSAPRPQSSGGKSVEPLSRMRQTIAQRMVEAKTGIPHFYVTSKIVVDSLLKLKDTLKPLSQYEGITFNHLIIRGVALALRKVPRVNASYADGSLIQPQDINVGIVTAVTDGLLIPVLKTADQLPLSEVVSESRGLVSRARSGRPKGDDLSGGTFSISNMGLFAVESFSAIISPGQGAILAVSSIADEPIVVGGEIKPGKTVRMTLSVDHRIIDGVVAGEFMTELKRLLEEPVLLLA